MKPSQITELLNFAIKNNFPVLLKGAPGIGKTELVRKASEEAGAELIISHPVVSDPTDYKGLPFVVNGGAEFLPFGELKRIMTAEKKTVYFLDDLGQAPVSVQASVMQLLLERNINGNKISDEVVFMAATNRREDKAGVGGLLEPVKSRFSSIIEMEVDVNDWVSWALNNGMPTALISFIRYRPELLHKFQASRDLVNTPSPRTVANVGRLINAGLPQNIEYEVVSGATGEGFATEFLSFLKVFRSLPDPNQIIMNPDGVEVPTDPATLYALVGALVNLAGVNTYDNIMKYLRRMPVEYALIAVKDSITKDASITGSREYIRWATENQSVIV